MDNKLLKEIINFKNAVKMNGMYLNDYLNTRKEFLSRIECASNKGLRFFRILYFYNYISQEQYLEFKMKIDDARKYYKKILSFY